MLAFGRLSQDHRKTDLIFFRWLVAWLAFESNADKVFCSKVDMLKRLW